MKAPRFVFVFFALTLCLLAQNPQGNQKTIVIRGDNGSTNGLFWDGDKTLLYFTTDQDWGVNNFCDPSHAIFNPGSQRTLIDIIASGRFNLIQKGPVMARVYYPSNDVPFNSFAALCSLVRDEQPAAEGVINLDVDVLNWCAPGPGSGQLTVRLSGSLINISAPCPGRRVSVSYETKLQLKPRATVDPNTCEINPGDLEVIKASGPTIHCIQ